METALSILVCGLTLVSVLLVLSIVSKNGRKPWVKFRVALPGGLGFEFVVSFSDTDAVSN